ncbi:unnamed protein product, partial [Mesorhabditis belari]|uniref:PHD-type domain-containing protein n=1 Tax=Mesorhabditis belari TaxID=2138241 RepID=A0AAF3EML2_9BILA
MNKGLSLGVLEEGIAEPLQVAQYDLNLAGPIKAIKKVEHFERIWNQMESLKFDDKQDTGQASETQPPPPVNPSAIEPKDLCAICERPVLDESFSYRSSCSSRYHQFCYLTIFYISDVPVHPIHSYCLPLQLEFFEENAWNLVAEYKKGIIDVSEWKVKSQTEPEIVIPPELVDMGEIEDEDEDDFANSEGDDGEANYQQDPCAVCGGSTLERGDFLLGCYECRMSRCHHSCMTDAEREIIRTTGRWWCENCKEEGNTFLHHFDLFR